MVPLHTIDSMYIQQQDVIIFIKYFYVVFWILFLHILFVIIAVTNIFFVAILHLNQRLLYFEFLHFILLFQEYPIHMHHLHDKLHYHYIPEYCPHIHYFCNSHNLNLIQEDYINPHHFCENLLFLYYQVTPNEDCLT